MKNFIVTTLILMSTIAYSQQSSKVLILKHKHRNTFKYIKPGKKICYWYENNRRVKNKGRISNIKDTVFFVEGKPISPVQLSKISARTTGRTLASIAGGVVIATGTLVSTTGVIIIASARGEDGCDDAFATIVGGVMTVTGAVMIGVGSIPIFIGGKRYDLHHDWDLIIADEVDKKDFRKRL